MTSSQGGSKGFQQVDTHLEVEYQGDANVFAGIIPDSLGDDELRTRTHENVQDGCNQVAVRGAAAPQAPQQQPQGSMVHWERFLHVSSIKVMLVENDDCTRHIVTALLRNCNYEVIEAANGFQAWKILEDLSNHIDIVLTEVVMPCLSGIGLLCKIMSHKTHKNLPVIMMSSHDSMGLVFKCLSKGAVDFLVKPIWRNELKILWQHVWRRRLNSSGSGSESGTQAQTSVNSKNNLRDDNNGSKHGDDNGSIGGSSDDGSGTQSSWTKQAVESESPCDQIAEHLNSTCGLVIRPIRGSIDHEKRPNNGQKAKEIEGQGEPEKNMDENTKVIDDSNGVIAGDLGLKRPRATENDGVEVQNQNGCNILRHSELSAFMRYKTNSNDVKGTPGITASRSQPDNRSNIVKKESKCDAHSDGYLIYQGSNEQVIPIKADEPCIQHIHHHHHVHHYHNIDTEQPLSNPNAPHCGSSNIMGGGGPVEGNLENYSMNRSGSGSKHGSNVQNGSNTGVNFEITNVESNVVIAGKSGNGDASKNGINHQKFAQREAALTKFRQKREARCFQKKVRYHNRKKTGRTKATC